MLSIESKEDAVHVARRIVDRAREMDDLVEKLASEDMIGLECAETVKLEKLSAENASAGHALAEWVVKEFASWAVKEHG
jgi:hypothetical protein